MSVLDRPALEASPLADLHTIASELSIDGYRRLRKAALIDLIIGRQEGTERDEVAEAAADAAVDTAIDAAVDTAIDAAVEAPDEVEAPAAETTPRVDEVETTEENGTASSRRRRGRRGGRSRGAGRDGTVGDDGGPSEAESESPATVDDGGDDAPTSSDREAQVVEGVVELLANGSGFVRVSPPDPTDDDVYISAAQVKRCELVNGDQVSGPKRAPHRSERFPSLIRIDTVNGRPASELADRARYDDLPAAFPSERFRLGSEDVTLKAIEWLTPFGRGSRVTITGRAWAGKSYSLRQLAGALAADETITVFVALAGVRPEEISEWSTAPVPPAAAISFAASADAQDHVVELVVDQARRIAARGGNAVVLIDTLDGLHPATASKALAAARKIVDGGSLTVIATSSRPIGGETTVIALEAALATTGRFPALDLVNSGTLRPELLVGEAGAQAIANARVEAQQ